MRTRCRFRWMAFAAVLAMLGAACGEGAPDAGARQAAAARVGVEPVPVVHLFENHSSSLVAWRRADVRDRVVVHLDGHPDLDWLPPETVARIAAASPDELRTLELHPYALDGDTLRRFAIWNFVYPAARLGIVRRMVWVVPDGTLHDPWEAWRLTREILTDKLDGVGLDEASGFRLQGRAIEGEVLGVPLTIVELRDLPAIEETVLLDIDLDYFTTRSAVSQEVVEVPWIGPEEVVAGLRAKGIRTDLATISYSTLGGFLPPENRWIGKALLGRLRDPATAVIAREALHREAVEAWSDGRQTDAVAALERASRSDPDDACSWYCLSKAYAATNRPVDAAAARQRAIELDPVLAHAALLDGDRAWLNGNWEHALTRYRGYLEELPVGPFTAYALRREAGSLMRLRRDDEAIAVFEKVLELAPSSADTLLDLGVLYRERGELDRAIDAFERAHRTIPDRSTYAQALGTTYLLAGRYEEGIAALEQAVAGKPTSVTARVNLASGLLAAGRPRDAAGHLRVALSLEPKHPRARELAVRVAGQGVGLTEPP